jgi:membrane protein implicated in regulation of membrane protease activity
MISEILADFSPTEKAFAAFAFMGTLFFFLRVVWMLVGGFGDHDVASDAAHGGGAHHDHASDSVFKLFSINSVTAFFMMFGWIGLTASRQWELAAAGSLLSALGAGVLSMLLIAWLFNMFLNLSSPGERFDIAATVGRTASVYQRIPAAGKGKVQVSLDGAMRELEAVAEDGQPIESFQNVTVLRVVDHQTVAVARLKN